MTEIDLEELRENLLQCRRCGICRNAVYEDEGFNGVCPVWKASTGFETSFMRGKVQIALALLDGELERTAENAESLYTCTLCGNCAQICAAEFNAKDCLEKVRSTLVDIPNDTRDSLAQAIARTGNPYSENASAKRSWVRQLGFKVPTRGETLYYVGCTTGLRLPDVAKSTAQVLKAARVDFAVMENEPCCGSVMLRTGRTKEAEENAQSVFSKHRRHRSGKNRCVLCGLFEGIEERLSRQVWNRIAACPSHNGVRTTAHQGWSPQTKGSGARNENHLSRSVSYGA